MSETIKDKMYYELMLWRMRQVYDSLNDAQESFELEGLTDSVEEVNDAILSFTTAYSRLANKLVSEAVIPVQPELGDDRMTLDESYEMDDYSSDTSDEEVDIDTLRQSSLDVEAQRIQKEEALANV